MILVPFQLVEVVPPVGQQRAGDQVEPGSDAGPLVFDLLDKTGQLIAADVSHVLHLVPVGVEGQVRSQEEDVVNLVLAPLAVLGLS